MCLCSKYPCTAWKWPFPDASSTDFNLNEKEKLLHFILRGHEWMSGNITVEKVTAPTCWWQERKSHVTAELGETRPLVRPRISARKSGPILLITVEKICAWSNTEDWHTDLNIPAAVAFFQPLNSNRWQLFLSFIPLKLLIRWMSQCFWWWHIHLSFF